MSNEWVKIEDGKATIGITKEALENLEEISYVELPQIGSEIKEGQELAILETTKSAIEIYSPISGTVVDVNKSLEENPEILKESKWLVKFCTIE